MGHSQGLYKVKAQETAQPTHWGEIFEEIDVIKELIKAGELKSDCCNGSSGSVAYWYRYHPMLVDPILQPILDVTPNPVKEVEESWVESGIVVGAGAKQKDRLAWMVAKYKYNPKDVKEVPRKVHQAGQPWFGWVLGIVRSYRKRTGT